MKHTYTKLAIAMLIATSGAAYAANFSNLSIGTVNALTISQTGNGSGRISSGNALTSTHTVTTTGTSAKNTTFAEAVDGSDAFTHVGSLATLSLTQATTSVNGTNDNNENTITGAMYTEGGSVTVVQTGDANAVDLAIGSSTASLTTPTISITQTGDDNQTELTRTAGTNTDTIVSTGNSNAVKVTGNSAGTNSVNLNLIGDTNQVWASQTGTLASGNAMKITVTGGGNILDLTQSGSAGSLTGTTGAGATIVGSSNYLFLAQSGSANTATLDIEGSTNKVDVSQSGATTSATLRLNGSGNDIGITQLGATTSANLILAATNATVMVTQNTLGASYTYNGTVPDGGRITVTQ